MEVWCLDIETLEMGIATVKSIPGYNEVPTHWRLTDECMVCRRLHCNPLYLGCVLFYHKVHSYIRLLSSCYFCASCEFDNRVLLQVLKDWRIIAVSSLEWERIISNGGVSIGTQVLIHAMKGNTRKRISTFQQVYSSIYANLQGMNYAAVREFI